MHFFSIKILQVLLGVYVLVFTFTEVGTFGRYGGARDPETGFIIDPTSSERTRNGLILWRGDLRSIVAANMLQMVLLGISRFSGFFMYPALVLVFFSKFRATGALLAQTPLSMFMIEDMHKLHIYCGWVILVDSIVHTIAHLSRWINQGNINLLWTHKSGVSGFVAVLSVLLIVLPMVRGLKQYIKFEIRKLFHYMFLIMALAMCFHTSTSSIPNGGFTPYVFPILLIWYGLDALYCTFFMTEIIRTTVYQTLSTGVQMTMKVSDRFLKWGENGGYGYVCFPWIDRNQWHAFSLYENPQDPTERQIFMQNVGDWTNKVHDQLQRSTVRPVWIQGPFQSPYSSTIKYDNQILVASGIGITPALSVIRSHKDTRRLNLIWAVRDPAMLQFFLEKAYLDHRGWNLIFYTGKQPLISSLVEELTSTNVCIIKERANLEHVIPNIIFGIESGKGLPEKYIPDQKEAAIKILSRRLDELDEQAGVSKSQKVLDLVGMAKDLGYVLQDLVGHLETYQDDDLEAGLRTVSSFPEGENLEGDNDDDGELLEALHPRDLHQVISKRGSTKSLNFDSGIQNKSKSDEFVLHERPPLQVTISAFSEKQQQQGKKLPPMPRKTKSMLRNISAGNPPMPMDSMVRHVNNGIKFPPMPDTTSRKRNISGGSAAQKVIRGPPVPRRRSSTGWNCASSIGTQSVTRQQLEQQEQRQQQCWDNIILEEMCLDFQPWEEIEEAGDYVKNLDQDKVLATWGILYCGGRNPLYSNLKKVAKCYGIQLHSEAFDW